MEEEEEYKQDMLKKMADGDRLEQMNNQKARLKREEHKKEVQRLLEERRKSQQIQKQV